MNKVIVFFAGILTIFTLISSGPYLVSSGVVSELRPLITEKPTPPGNFTYEIKNDENTLKVTLLDTQSNASSSSSQTSLLPTQDSNTKTSPSSGTYTQKDTLISYSPDLSKLVEYIDVSKIKSTEITDYSRPAPSFDVSPYLPSTSTCTSVKSAEIGKDYYKCSYSQKPSGIGCKAIAPYNYTSTLWSCN